MQGTWSEMAPLPEARESFAACAIENDIYVFGGLSRGVSQASVFKYDTVANIWSTLTPIPEASAYYSASVLDGLVYLVGAGLMHSDLYQFDPA
jgi:N-acetylneuraminic acid mutarotase